MRHESECLKRIKRVELCMLERVSGVRLESAYLKRIKRVELCMLGELVQFMDYRIGLHFARTYKARSDERYVNYKKILNN